MALPTVIPLSAAPHEYRASHAGLRPDQADGRWQSSDQSVYMYGGQAIPSYSPSPPLLLTWLSACHDNLPAFVGRHPTMAGDCGTTCPASDGFYSYNPSVGGNAVLLVVFALLALAAIYFGIRSRTYLFSLALTTGLFLEALGFVGRILLHSKRDSQSHFFLFLFGTVLGPSLINVAIFIILPHILGIYGEPLCPFRPLVAGLVFWGLAAVTVLFELIGIVFTAYESNGVTRKQGAAITATGLAIQALSLMACTGLHFWFTLSLSTRRGTLDARHSQVYSSSRFKKFLLAMEMASALLIVYSFYRLVEFADGVSGDVFQNEAAFMVVGGLLPLLAAVLLTAIHPGNAFADAWAPTSPRGIKRQSRPTPVQSPTPSGHPVHHLYDPDIRKQISPTSPKHRNSAGPPELPQGSMGLPAHPKPVPRPPSPRDPNVPRKGPPAPLNLAAVRASRNSCRAEQRGYAPKDMVPDGELW